MSGKTFEDTLLKERSDVTGGPVKVVPLFPPGEQATLPGYGDPYKAAAVPANGNLTRLCCILGKDAFRVGEKPYRFFQYVHLDSHGELGYSKDGQVMTLRFSGMRPVTITVTGRNLMRICDYIQLHRMAWIRMADRDFSPADAVDANGEPLAIITNILIADVKTGELI